MYVRCLLNLTAFWNGQQTLNNDARYLIVIISLFNKLCCILSYLYLVNLVHLLPPPPSKKKNLDLLFLSSITDEYSGSVLAFVLYMYYSNSFKMFNFPTKGVGKLGAE